MPKKTDLPPISSLKIPVPILGSLLFILLSGTQTGCATNPVTGQRELALVSESQEIAMGQQYAPEIAASMGVYPDEALQSYLSEIGLKMARVSERPDLPWQFQVVDDSVVNAFAVPGGFIYFTRGILAHMDSEAELASVMGHEIGHVTARHSVRQISKQQLANIAIGVGTVLLPPEMRALGQVATQGAQLLFLKFGRDDESQADGLGLRYMDGQGYQPYEMVEMFRTLGRVSAAAGGAGRVPEWMSTHPDPANRERAIEGAIRAQGLGTGEIGRDRFLDRIDGLTYGPDPRQGFFDGGRFHHPELAFRLDFPVGWQTANQTQAVLAGAPEQDAMIQLTLAGAESAEAAAQQMSQSEGLRLVEAQRTSINGFNAVVSTFQAQTQQGIVQGRVAFIEHGERVMQLMGYAPEQRFSQHARAIDACLSSYARETDARVLGAEPWQLSIIRTDRELSQEEFARFYPGPVDAATLARLNQIDAGIRYRAGTRYKRVVGKAWASE
ncbi:MAG: M48 family metalloprotease [Myxococcota bacterium]